MGCLLSFDYSYHNVSLMPRVFEEFPLGNSSG